MSPLLEPRASACLRLALSGVVATASLAPRPARAEPAISAAAEEHYDRGVREREAGRFAAAAAEFAVAYAEIPAARKDLQAGVLFDLIDAHRSAFASGGKIRGKEHPAVHLCVSEEALTAFIDEAEKQRVRKTKKSPDVTRAIDLRSEVRKQLDAARKSSPDLDCATVEYPREEAGPEAKPGGPEASRPAPRPQRKIDKPLVIAGGVSTGVGLIFLGVMAGGLVRGKQAEADGDALVAMKPTEPMDSDALQEIDHRGKVGNRMAIAGGVIGALALGAGVALLVVGLRGGPSRRVALSPVISPQDLGMRLRWQF